MLRPLLRTCETLSDGDRTTDALGREEARTDRRRLQEASWDRSAKETRDLSEEGESVTGIIVCMVCVCDKLTLGLSLRALPGGCSEGGKREWEERGRQTRSLESITCFLSLPVFKSVCDCDNERV